MMTAIEYEKRCQLQQDYSAQVLWMLGKVLAGEGWKLNSYIDMAYPDGARGDARTAEDIKHDILEMLKQ